MNITSGFILRLGLVLIVSMATGPVRAQEKVAVSNRAERPAKDIEREPWRDLIEVLRVGVMTGSEFDATKRRLEPFRAHLESHLKLPVELVAHKDWGALVLAQATSRVDYSILTSGAYAGAWTTCECVEPLAISQASDGSTSYHSVLIAKAGSGYNSLRDLQGRKLLYTVEGSTTGHLLPRTMFKKLGFDPDTHFKSAKFAGSAEKAIKSVLRGKADAALTWSSMQGSKADGYSRGALHFLVSRDRLKMSDISIIWQSGEIPNAPHAVRSSLPESLKANLRTILTSMAETNPDALHAVGFDDIARFVTVRHEAFDILIDIAGGRVRDTGERG